MAKVGWRFVFIVLLPAAAPLAVRSTLGGLLFLRVWPLSFVRVGSGPERNSTKRELTYYDLENDRNWAQQKNLTWDFAQARPRLLSPAKAPAA